MSNLKYGYWNDFTTVFETIIRSNYYLIFTSNIDDVIREI